MKKKNIGFRFAAAALAALLLFAGCSAKSGSTSSSSAAASQSSGAAAKSDTYTYGIAGDPGNAVNVISTDDRYGLTEIKLIYSPLYMYNVNKVVYFLAESMTPSADGLTYTAKLRHDVKWSDGQPFTADDVVFTYQKMEEDSAAGWAYSQLVYNDKAVKVEKVDDYTVKFTFPEKNADALELLGDIFIMPKHVYQNEKSIENSPKNAAPVGTGPYKLVEYKAGQYVKFTANEDYFLGAPKIKNVVFRIITDYNTKLLAMQKGEINSCEVQPQDVSKFKSDTNISIYPYSEGRVGYLAFNLKSKTVQNADLRKAVLYALNRQQLLTASFYSTDFAVPAYTFLPTESPYYTTDGVQKYDTDTAKAKQLLSQAGVSRPSLKLAYANDSVAYQLQAAVIQQELGAIGVNVTLEGLDDSAMSDQLEKHTGNFDLYLDGYIMGIDPSTFSSLFTTGSSSNFLGLADSTVDSLFSQGVNELDVSKRKTIYAKLQARLQDDAVFYPIIENKRVLAIDSDIGGIQDASLVPVYHFEDLSKLFFK